MADIARNDKEPVQPVQDIHVGDVQSGDLDAIMAIDEQNSGVTKLNYWRDAYARHVAQPGIHIFLVARRQDKLVGFILGEVRAWEFGSPPCGWVIVIGVRREERLAGIGTSLMTSLYDRFRRAGIVKIRTMAATQNHEMIAFFRSQGMMAGPYQQLETELE